MCLACLFEECGGGPRAVEEQVGGRLVRNEGREEVGGKVVDMQGRETTAVTSARARRKTIGGTEQSPSVTLSGHSIIILML